MDYNTVLKNNINILKDKSWNVRLHAEYDEFQVTKFLLRHGADINNYFDTIEWCMRLDLFTIVRLILKYEPNARIKEEWVSNKMMKMIKNYKG